MKTRILIAAVLVGANFCSGVALANSTAQTLPFTQNWTNTSLITANDDWSTVPGIEGFLGQDITTATGADPQTLVTTSTVANDLDVIANQSNPNTNTAGGVAEFDGIANPTIALQGSGTADAPYIIINLNTTGQSNINVAYNLRDIDGSADNAVQPVALQYRVGNSGNFTNIPAGYVADASTGPSLATLVTPVSVTLPVAAENQSLVQVRIITANAAGSDEWIGIDDINITAGAGPAQPTLNINDVTQAEGNAGTTTFTFTVSLTAAAPAGGVSFTVNTADGTTNPANAGSDYVAIVNGAGSIPEGATSTTVNVTVIGDTTLEPSETFFVNISGVTGATAGDVQGLGTIQNDEVTLTAIHTIQGSGTASPFANGTSLTTTGIVTGLRSNGFFLQTPDAGADADPNTSEGIFIFTASAPPAATVAIGNSVQVTGTLSEFSPPSDPASPPLTELTSPSVVLLSTGNALPAPITITAAETTAASETSNPLDSLEEYESMRVTVASLTVVGPTQGTITEPSATVASNGVFYGVVTGVPRPFREPGIAISDPLPAGAPGTIPRFDENPERIRVDSDGQPGASAIDVAAGTTITNITGVLDFAFRTYTILPDAATPPTVGAQPASRPVPTPAADEITIASANLERFFDTANDPATSDPVLTQTAFDRRVAKASLIIRTVMRSPDVIGVEEMENLTTLQAVANKINADAGTPGDYVAYLQEGNDIGGIDNGFLVRSSRITVIDVTQVGKTDTFTNPDNSTAILNDRPPLVLRATAPKPSGGTLAFTVIVNHLRSLSGVDDTTAGSNGFATEGERVRFKRRAQAEFLANYIQGRQTANPAELIFSVGDYNAFRVNDGYVDVIGTILGTPAPASQVTLASNDLVNPDLTDLVDTLPAAEQYSYNFDGNAQTLDHIIVNQRALSIVSRFAYARDDSDFAVKNYESINELRISDHDQPVVYVSLTATPTPPPTPAQALNLSTRMRVDIGDKAVIAGFIITGNTSKDVVIRGLGPSLVNSNVPAATLLNDPYLELHAPNGSLITSNDNWVNSPQRAQFENTVFKPTDDRESVILAKLSPGNYTAILTGVAQTTGIGLIEVYDNNQASDSVLANISTRGFVQTADNVMIGGFTLGGNPNNARIAVRGIGPSLAQYFGVGNVLADPTLELHNANGTIVISNDDWTDNSTSAGQLSANGLALQNPKESGIFTTLPAGPFTVILAGKSGGVGIGLVEIYNVR
jgi:predicted extracellular nuclease